MNRRYSAWNQRRLRLTGLLLLGGCALWIYITVFML